MLQQFRPLNKPVELKSGSHHITWGDGKNFVLFGGPDIIEDEGLVLETGKEMKKVTQEMGIPWVLKCSYDKANRQSAKSFRGPGVNAALKSLQKIKSELGCLLLTDVHETNQVDVMAEVADVIQIPACCQNRKSNSHQKRAILSSLGYEGYCPKSSGRRQLQHSSL
jgi:2-dehydro-3-deoxyphosphooctonate aldolase (KDO 8-P synthase)